MRATIGALEHCGVWLQFNGCNVSMGLLSRG